MINGIVGDGVGAGRHIGTHDGFAAVIGNAARDVIRCRGCIGDIQRGSRIGDVDGVGLPPAENSINHGTPSGAEFPSLAERQFINKARGVDKRRVQAGRAAFGSQVVNVLRVGSVVAGTVFQ